MKELENWKKLNADKSAIEKQMEEALKPLLGRTVLFQIGNMSIPANGVVEYVSWLGDRITVRNIVTGKKRHISPSWLVTEK